VGVGVLIQPEESHKSKRKRKVASKPAADPFVNESERDFASILDFYQIRWEYEPRTFPLQWDDNGTITESFSPDFYLPELDLYVELTTLKQSLVTKKNRKLRRLRELYPDVNIKLFYGRDYRRLMDKYGFGPDEHVPPPPPEPVTSAANHTSEQR
jgi:hypothetical protein